MDRHDARASGVLSSLWSKRVGLLAALVGLGIGCANDGSLRGVPPVPGGSVTDVDRDSSDYVPGRSKPQGAPETIGALDWGDDRAAAAAVVEEMPAPSLPKASPSAIVAGPPESGRLITDPETVRSLQVALSAKGFFHGAANGVPDDALRDALRRYQADQHVPATGQLDGETAHRLGVSMPAPLPPPPG